MPDTRITVRLPDDVATALRARAAADDRSLNRQIVFLLRQALLARPDSAAQSSRAASASLSLGSMPRYKFPRPTNRRPRGDAES